ncbi:MAG: hypothetical protein P8M30_16990 [Planctomycetaceae bacterium]|jgi:tRNA-modifying protein YgfZ|nr:hypothetical protein [Planctomycetaceae bacterium]
MPLLSALQNAGLIDIPADAQRPIADFGDPLREYQAAWTSAALIVGHGFGMITVTGEDRAKFLHNFCTNDIKKMQPGETSEAFFCNVKGRILAVAVIICEADRFRILTDESRVEFLHQHLDKYLITEDVTLSVDDDVESLLISGKSDELGKMLSAISDVGLFPWENGFRPAFWLIGSTDSLVNVVKQGVADGAVIAGYGAWEIIRITAAFPQYGVDVSDENLAQEANRTELAISFTKGCYLGQEPIARLDAMGHVNRQLERFNWYEDSKIPPVVGKPVLNEAGEEVGTITSSCHMPNDDKLEYERGIVLTMVKTKANGGVLTAENEDGQPVILRKE